MKKCSRGDQFEVVMNEVVKGMVKRMKMEEKMFERDRNAERILTVSATSNAKLK